MVLLWPVGSSPGSSLAAGSTRTLLRMDLRRRPRRWNRSHRAHPAGLAGVVHTGAGPGVRSLVIVGSGDAAVRSGRANGRADSRSTRRHPYGLVVAGRFLSSHSGGESEGGRRARRTRPATGFHERSTTSEVRGRRCRRLDRVPRGRARVVAPARTGARVRISPGDAWGGGVRAVGVALASGGASRRTRRHAHDGRSRPDPALMCARRR